MKISEQWLREWVDPALGSAELVAQLTNAGLEVDTVEAAAPPFHDVVVGRVMAVEQHPNAQRLRITTVDVGADQTLQIVCGAPNVRAGMCAPTALLGAALPGGLKIEQSELRGVESRGMLCSARELGLGEDADGILELPEESVPGRDLRQYLGLDDQIIDIELTPNRGDCLSISGIAREVGVLNRLPVNGPAIAPVEPEIDDRFPVTLSNAEDCPRYVGRVIRAIDTKAQTPLWMCERLRRAGLRSLGPLVDVTNFVMLELGQPMHAFDLNKLSDSIDVRRARSGETLTLLNDQQITLDPDILLITDASGPIAMAGIMGGGNTEIDDSTRDILLESAFFSPLAIAGRARRFGLQTDASYRFERGVDPQLQERAVERATRLLIDIAGGRPGPICGAVAAQYLPAEKAIRLRPERIELLLGTEIESSEVSEILTRLGMAVAEEHDHWIVVPPGLRFDITMEADLIEEIARIHGYNRLPISHPQARLAMRPRVETQVTLSRMRDTLVQRSFQETISYSFVDPSVQQVLDPEHDPIPLSNPISVDMSVMRTSLWPGLIKALVYNQKRQQSRIRLFENGLTFQGRHDALVQESYIGGIVCGEAVPEQWGLPGRRADFFDLKGDVEALLDLTGRREDFLFTAAKHPALHPGQSARIDCDDQAVGWIGALHPNIERKLGIDSHSFVFELRIAGIARARLPAFSALSKFPASRRDLAVIVTEETTAAAIHNCIRAQGGELLREVQLFDVYRGKGVDSNHKSMAFGLILQDFSRNLTDQTVDTIFSRIVTGLQQQLNATLRM